ncbi:MAG: hypothetical protein KBT87_11935 [Gammaproteobacteria bacterium]|jgi:protein CpxP|nr:hypothetical protein [Gammaproteobacteria bacterium]MBQ0775375.1 hypothetical protein [Gammaproteobacteria bacterium]|tara:strand:+ start:46774 stop:47109 length:336 start_codon:yes stop_codon:yes gene_type:complete
MKNLLIATCIMLPLAAFAGDKKNPHSDSPFGGPRMEKVVEALELTDSQKNQVEQVFKTHREKMQSLREETENNVNAILTADQRQKLDKMKEKRHDKRDERKEKRQEKRKEK